MSIWETALDLGGDVVDFVTGDEEGAAERQRARDARDARREDARAAAVASGEDPDEAVRRSDEQAAQEEADREATALEPINYQCLVLEAAHKLAEVHVNDYLPASPYKNVTPLKCGDEYGNIISRINHGNKTDEVKEIMSLCPDVYALLTPYIHLSRVLYDADGKPKPVPAQPLKIPNFLSRTDVQNILDNNLERVPGAGIKSFKWELEGVQPAEVDNNITATLQVYFQSVADFFKGSEDTQGNAQAGRPEPTFLDLIINSPTVNPTPGSSPSAQPSSTCPSKGAAEFQQYQGENFRIKVCAGWSVPPNLEKIYPKLRELGPDNQTTRGALLEKAIAATRVSLFLQQVRHDIALNQDGSLTLTIKYQAALSGLTTSAGSNIFAAGSRETNVVKLRQKIKDERRLDPEYDDTADLEQIDKLEQEDRKERYSKLLKGIYKSKKIYTMRVPVSQLRSPKLHKLPENERRTEARRRYAEINAMPSPTTGATQQSDLLTSLARTATAAEAGEEATEAASDRNERIAELTPADKVDVQYMYLGDLLDAVLSNLPGAPPSGEAPYECFTAEFEFLDILRYFQLTDNSAAEQSRCEDPASASTAAALQAANPYLNLTNRPLYRKIPIGSIPISLDAFQAFFVEQVVDKERDKYYFLHFVKDLCAKLITRALSSECYGGSFRFFQRFDVQPLSFHKTDFGAETTVEALAAAKSELTCEVMEGSKFGLGMVVISTDSKRRNLRGNFDDDTRRGIYHHFLGSACGLVKKIEFQREDQPYLREAKIQRAGALGAEQLRELFSANIELVGNNLYKNGSYIYINPMLIGATQKQLNYLGLHGYFLVTSVSSEITEKSFTTQIRALQEGLPFVDSDSDSTVDGAPPPTPPEPSTANGGN